MTYHHPLTTTLTHVQLNISTGEKKLFVADIDFHNNNI